MVFCIAAIVLPAKTKIATGYLCTLVGVVGVFLVLKRGTFLVLECRIFLSWQPMVY